MTFDRSANTTLQCSVSQDFATIDFIRHIHIVRMGQTLQQLHHVARHNSVHETKLESPLIMTKLVKPFLFCFHSVTNVEQYYAQIGKDPLLFSQCLDMREKFNSAL